MAITAPLAPSKWNMQLDQYRRMYLVNIFLKAKYILQISNYANEFKKTTIFKTSI